MNHLPEIGTWYINLNNQFLRIWAVVYDQDKAQKVVLHYLNGTKSVISINAWEHMELIRYPEQTAHQNDVTQG
ncbi:hypothetical protein ACFL2V_20185 [Pseudomonadota bacterium]